MNYHLQYLAETVLWSNNCLRDYPPSEEDAEQIRLTAERIASTERPIILHSENQEEEILRKLMEAVSEFKDRMSSGAKWAKEKIGERQIDLAF
jgi:Zn-finger protein